MFSSKGRMALAAILLISTEMAAQPIRLHPDNPHYLEYRGELIVLVTSAEHYGAVINGEFDFERYLKTLHDDGMNYTRIFTGSYIENPESTFGIERNTLAPVSPDLFVSPWIRTDQPGAHDGGNLFDLDRWNPAYFDRLRAFVKQAEDFGIIVEVTLFSSIYQESNWIMSPLHKENNINQVDTVAFRNVHTYNNKNLINFQLAYVRKIVSELNAFDNVFFEIQNEPWADQGEVKLYANPNNNGGRDGWWTKIEVASGASLDWQHTIAQAISETEANLPGTHLIAQNFANFKYPLAKVDSLVSILNFHYAWPDAVHLNYGLNRVISFDESGFTGNEDETYRKQAWRFMIAGGGIFNNLDYSFAAGHEDGTFKSDSPGGGSPNLRKQLRFLSDLLHQRELATFAPDRNVVVSAPGFLSQALANPIGTYIVYLERIDRSFDETLVLAVPSGTYRIVWMDPEWRNLTHLATINSIENALQIPCPKIGADAVVIVERQGSDPQ